MYNSYAFNMGFLSAEIPGWMSPRANLLPESLIAAYPGSIRALSHEDAVAHVFAGAGTR
ncbi:hypothetical protein [Azoarcus sp. KH32C]|uniref:hypothetical protein n=1 Tax=Azoarcus sp. KH32C TaxID=748247 RepID=UPI0002385E42|nr:hypothetical protein [Azoarcus sp. KH32C]BAL27244.1 hypothetical protein AZKH_p0361 [Azoarcus sp. KH32C]